MPFVFRPASMRRYPSLRQSIRLVGLTLAIAFVTYEWPWFHSSTVASTADASLPGVTESPAGSRVISEMCQYDPKLARELQGSQEDEIRDVIVTTEADYPPPKSVRYDQPEASLFMKDLQTQQEAALTFWREPWDRMVAEDEDADVEEYLYDFSVTCFRRDTVAAAARNRNLGLDSRKMCPCVPGSLLGRVKPDVPLLMSIPWQLLGHFGDAMGIRPGGFWSPRDCIARRRVAVIIPYRDRETHLRAFLVHMHPVFQRQLLEYRIFVIEQRNPARFNKATMMNVGFLEAHKLNESDCFLFHDVDLLLEDDRVIFHCSDNPVHYAVALDRWNYTLKYNKLLGGAVALTNDQFTKVNGFSNEFFGWGGEDDDFSNRVRKYYKIERPHNRSSTYTAMVHGRDVGNPYNKRGVRGLRTYAKTTYQRQGLNTVTYNVSARVNRPLYTHIIVDLDITKLRLYYKNHIAFAYKEVRGACSGIKEEQGLPLSKVTCQFRCDSNSTCSAFVYSHHVGDNRCHLVNTHCTRTKSGREVTTYIKMGELPRPPSSPSLLSYIKGKVYYQHVLRKPSPRR